MGIDEFTIRLMSKSFSQNVQIVMPLMFSGN